MGLSSNVVWHQTDIGGLKAIIGGKSIKYSYSLETINGEEIAFPMISFCDIALADITEYLGKYGKYTIGFKRDWGRKIQLSPVWYRDKNALSLREQMKVFKEIRKKDSFSLSENEIMMWYSIAYTKNHTGKLLKYNFESYRFYDERELRLVLSYEDLCNAKIKPFMSKEEYEVYKKSNKKSSLIDKSIPFEYNDIAYILYSDKSQSNKVRSLLGAEGKKIVFLSYDQVMQDIIGASHNRESEERR